MKPTVEQQAVIEHGTGPALVLADAGSGKTTTILLRIKNLIRRGVPANQILMITFSRAGTEDMIRRARELGVPRGVQYRTLHSVGKEMIKRGFPLQEERTFRWPREDSSEDEGGSMTFSIPTEGEEAKKEPAFGQRVGRKQSLDIDIEKLMKATLLNYKDELEAKGPVSRAHLAPKVSEVMKLIDFSKSNLIFPDLIDETTGELFCEGAWSSSDGTKFPCFMDWAWENLRISEDENEPGRIPVVIEAVQRCYMKLQMASACPEYHSSNEYYALHAHRWITFSDMIALPAQAILMGLPWVSPWWGRFSFVIVDEVQDNNLGQWAMVRHLARDNNLMAVGDDSQSIFSFRGARPELMGFFRQELMNSQVYGLSVNFRCPHEVVNQANNLLSHAPNKLKEKPAQALESALPGRITVTSYAEPLREARGVVKKIQGYQAAGFPSHEIAVIYRTHASAGAVEIELIRNRIPYRVQGSPFFSKPIVAATIGYLGLALEPGDREWLKACYCKPLRSLNRAFLNTYDNYAAAVNAFENDEVKQWRWKRGIPNLRKAVTETRKALKEKGVGDAIRHVLWKLELVKFFVNRASGDGKIEIEDYARNLEDLGDCYDSAEDLLRYVRLMRDDDIAEADHDNTYLNKKSAPGRVVLSTIHRCVHPDTLIETGEGLIPIKLASKSGLIGTPKGPLRYKNLVRNPSRIGIKVTTERGYELTMTPDHGIQAWGGNGYRRHRADELKEGQFVRLKLGVNCPAGEVPSLPSPGVGDIREHVCKIPQRMSSELAEFLGLIVGDGTCYKRGVRLKKRHEEVVNRFCALGKSLFGLNAIRKKEQAKKPGYNLTGEFVHYAEINSTKLCRWLEILGGTSPQEKSIPECVLRSPAIIQASFLRGLFEDGTVNVKKGKLDHIDWSNKSEEMAKQVQVMLLRFGVACKRRRVEHQGRNNTHIYIYGEFASKFGRSIGMISKVKQDRLSCAPGRQMYPVPIAKNELRFLRNQDRANASHRGRVSRWKAALVPDLIGKLGFFHDPIKSIEIVECESMCVEVPEMGRFLQNGFDGHNCKGLEYGTVFLIRANEGVVPHRLADLSEERRLFYVAVTRTKSTCEISYVQETTLGPAFQSQFIQELKQRKEVRIGRKADESLASLA